MKTILFILPVVVAISFIANSFVCADKGLKGYKRNIGLDVLAYNLHILAIFLKKQPLQKEEKSSADKTVI